MLELVSKVVEMKKVLIFIVMLLMPLSVYANDYKVTNHIIDTEVEIAGAIKVKELIVVEGKIDYLNRKLNYYSFGTKAWDGKEAVDFEGSSFYNAPSVSINKVSAFKLTDKIDINNLNRDETSALKEFDLKNISLSVSGSSIILFLLCCGFDSFSSSLSTSFITLLCLFLL